MRAYFHTYGLPAITTNGSNIYGPFQHPEKLIPLMITHALSGKPLPVYGDGLHVRNWLYVTDHCESIRLALARGRNGHAYCVGGLHETRNIDLVLLICDTLDQLRPNRDGSSYRDQVTYVADRPGHDRRYATDSSKIGQELGWRPRESFEAGIRKTIRWYLDNQWWVNRVLGEDPLRER